MLFPYAHPIIIGNKAPKTSGTSLMTNTFMNIIMTIRFSLTRLCSNTIYHTTIAGFWQLDFRVDTDEQSTLPLL